MRGIVTLAMCALAGCGEKALLIEIETTGHVDGVELFLVQQQCADCTGMGPPGADQKLPGHVFYTDNDARVYSKIDPTSNSTRFWIEPSTGGDHLLRIIAVGFDAQQQPNALTELGSDIVVSAHRGERWNVNLQPRAIAISGVAPLDIGAQDAITLWRPPVDQTNPTATDGHASCLMIEHADQTQEFIVPPVDADCDNIIDGECDRTWYIHNNPVDPTKVCLDATRTDECRVGYHSDCIDGVGSAGGCVPSSYCIPDQACASLCNVFDASCFDKLFLNAGAGLPRLECSISVAGNSGVAPFAACGGTTVDGSAFTGCTSVGLSTVATFPPVPQTPFVFAIGSDDVTITLGPPTPVCKFTLSVGTTLSAVPIGMVHPAAFLLTGANGDTMAIPLVLNFRQVSACAGNEITCAFMPVAMPQRVWNCGK